MSYSFVMKSIGSFQSILFGLNKSFSKNTKRMIRRNDAIRSISSSSSSLYIQNSFKSLEYQNLSSSSSSFQNNSDHQQYQPNRKIQIETSNSSFFESKISEPLRNKIKETISRYELLNETLSSPSIDGRKSKELAKELGNISDTHYYGTQWFKLNKQVTEYEKALKEEQDETLKELIKEELQSSLESLQNNESELISSMIDKDPADERDAILEVRAGAGGDEASLFAQDMLNMYEKYCGEKGWNFRLLSSSASGVNGIKEASASIKGEGAFGRLRHETGVHRVQRVPTTETMGRTHTSTMTVAVLPVAQEVRI
eukprot:TRINITY_DN5263_c0_g1_i3.p1 TRINITY_DN5263_c0_g1~~TRINITY_DN5263_c0_g1_i3.p1  ORF type:complete len:313 (+),score=105.13 TRINITY_DN5263_c0_g1_i3:151-1089(+)